MNLSTGGMFAVKEIQFPKSEINRSDLKLKGLVDSLKSVSNTLVALGHPNIVQHLGIEEAAGVLSM